MGRMLEVFCIRPCIPAFLLIAGALSLLLAERVRDEFMCKEEREFRCWLEGRSVEQMTVSEVISRFKEKAAVIAADQICRKDSPPKPAFLALRSRVANELLQDYQSPPTAAEIRYNSALVLSEMDPKYLRLPSVKLKLEQALRDPDDDVRGTAASLIASTETEGASLVPLLIRSLLEFKSSYSPEVAALGRIGSAAAPGLPILKRMATQAWGGYRIMITEAIVRIDPKDTDGIALLQSGITGANPSAIARVTRVIREMGISSPGFVEPLEALLASTNASVRFNASRTLLRVRPGHSEAIRILETFLSARFQDDSIEAAQALVKAKPQSQKALSYLRRRLREMGEHERLKVACVLLGEDLDAELAAAVIRKQICSLTRDDAINLVRQLARMPINILQATLILRELAAHKDPSVRKAALDGLASRSPASPL